ncbi:PEP-CTERM sorting domain-containing protein [Microcystis aeruginosa BLCCF158]|uniref:PEP-CTERM sorting domain-containing protein n=1 Tax=Microcystis aeruginosa BLCC-F158 TaxID=2755316 RepID=A0A841V5X3_MICAE|nr:PEP-CTERM sorting domain-containing protein [Microcystis aeruginosa BLCC-F158]
MIKEFSKRVTTVALATAGSVAAFGFATTSPVQAAPIAACPSMFTLGDFAVLGNTGCYVGDKRFQYLDADPSTGNITTGLVFISSPPTAANSHSFSYRPQPTALTQTGGQYTIDYLIEVYNDPGTSVDETLTQFFHQFSIGYDSTGMQDQGVTVTKTVWLDGIGGTQLVGTSQGKSSDLGGNGSPGNIVTVPGHVQKLFVRDVFGTTNAMGAINSVTNDFTQKTKVPEPSAILGILAVAGIGAFARRKS